MAGFVFLVEATFISMASFRALLAMVIDLSDDRDYALEKLSW